MKPNLANLKADVDEKDVEKLQTVLVDLSKLHNDVNNNFVKKTVYDKLVAKVDISGFVLKPKYDR